MKKFFQSGALNLWLIFGIFGLMLVANTFLVMAATGDPSFSVEEDYYQKALNWDQRAAQKQREAALGWSIQTTTLPGGHLQIDVRDSDKIFLGEALVTGTVYHKARSSESFALKPQLNETGTRFVARLPHAKPGLWRATWRVLRGTDEVTHDETFELRPDTP